MKLIYIGPSLSRGRLNTLTVFCDGLPGHLQEVYDDIPHIKALFVEVENLNESLVKRNTKGTPLFKYYQEVKEYDL